MKISGILQSQRRLKIKRTIPFLAMLFVILSHVAYSEKKDDFVYDEFVQDKHLKEGVLKVVKDYINGEIKKKRFLSVRGTVFPIERKFKVVEIFAVVSRKDNIYTVQVDVDEIGGEPRYLLLCDVEEQNGKFKLKGIRIDGRHLRQKMMP